MKTKTKTRWNFHGQSQRLRRGDVIELDGREATVLRVNMSSATIETLKPPQKFVTSEGKDVHIRGGKQQMDIAPSSMSKILRRGTLPEIEEEETV